MFGDILRNRVDELSLSSINKNSSDSFWKILRDIAVEDIKAVKPTRVDSDTAIAIYYEILTQNYHNIPPYYLVTLKSNGQERFRVINRNLWSSNAFHPEGLANQDGIHAFTAVNESKKGSRVIYQGE